MIALRGSMSTIEAAKKLGISQQYYSYIENGKRQKRMDIQMCERIASAFGIEIYDVIKYESLENENKGKNSGKSENAGLTPRCDMENGCAFVYETPGCKNCAKSCKREEKTKWCRRWTMNERKK